MPDYPDTPITRDEQYLANALGENVEMPTPITREEKYLYNIAVNINGGITAADNGKVVVNGQLTEQTSRTVTSNDTYDTTTNNSVTVNVPSPNSVETVTGTVADPWGAKTISELFDLAKDGDATVYIEVSGIAGLRFLPRGYVREAIFRQFQATSSATRSSADVYKIQYASNGTLSDAFGISAGQETVITDIDPTAQTTLTIIHHPLPSA